MKNFQEEIARLEGEAKEAGEYFAKLMGDLPTGESDIEQVCRAFRSWASIQTDANEQRVRCIAAALTQAGSVAGLNLNSLNLNLPVIG